MCGYGGRGAFLWGLFRNLSLITKGDSAASVLAFENRCYFSEGAPSALNVISICTHVRLASYTCVWDGGGASLKSESNYLTASFRFLT